MRGVKSAHSGRNNAILYGGVNVAQPTILRYHEVLPASRMNDSASMKFNLCGSLCQPADFLAQNNTMPAHQVGDTVALMDAGTYFIPYQMNFFDSKAAAVIVEDGNKHVILGR